jgi:hypothetical protein
VLFITFFGAAIGLGNALLLEIPALLGKPSRGALSLLQPSYRPVAGTGVMHTAFILLIEVAANVLIYSLMFFLLGWLVVGIRRIFAGNRDNSAS